MSAIALALLAGLALAPAGAQSAGRHASTIIPTGTRSTLKLTTSNSSSIGAPSPLGDVNGDGLDDIATQTVEGPESYERATVRVVFGVQSGSYPGALDSLGSGGFSIRGASWAGPAGDVDGDGLNDILVNGHVVVYGDRGNADVTLGAGSEARTTTLTPPPKFTRYRPIGDFNGDGRDDLASYGDITTTSYALVALGGPRVPTIATTGARTFRFIGWRRCVPYYLTPYGIGGGCKDYADVPEAAGDLNGDGLDDLVVTQGAVANGDRNTDVRTWVVYGRAAAADARIDVRSASAVGLTELSYPGAPGFWSTVAAGFTAWEDDPGHDADGDGLDDLKIATYSAEQGNVTRYLPGVDATGSLVVTDAALRPLVGDPDGYDPIVASTADSEFLKEAPPVGDLDGDGRLDGAGLFKEYADIGAGTTDPAYPRGALVIYAGDEDRLPPVQYPHAPGAANGVSRVSGWYDGFLRFGAFEKSKVETVWRREGETQPLKVLTYWPGTTPGVNVYTAFGGQTLPDGRYEVQTTAIDAAGNRSKAEVWPFDIGPPQGPDPARGLLDSLDGAWKIFGTAIKLADGGVQLTAAIPSVHGETYWPAQINRQALGTETVSVVEFDAEMTDGSPGGGGMTVAFTNYPPGQDRTPGTGSSLGFAPQKGSAFAMQTYRATKTDPSANFVGFTNGPIANSRPVALQWLGTADPGVSLRGAPFHVKVEIGPGKRQAWINDRLVLTGSGEFGTGKYLQFTASTGPGQFQRHVVRNVRFTQRAN